MTRPGTDDLKLRAPFPTIPGVASLGIRVTYPKAPEGFTTALLRLPNDYVVAMVHSPGRKWAAMEHYYVVPGTGVVDPRPLPRNPLTGAPGPRGIVWDWTDGSTIASVLHGLSQLALYVGDDTNT